VTAQLAIVLPLSGALICGILPVGKIGRLAVVVVAAEEAVLLFGPGGPPAGPGTPLALDATGRIALAVAGLIVLLALVVDIEELSTPTVQGSALLALALVAVAIAADSSPVAVTLALTAAAIVLVGAVAGSPGLGASLRTAQRYLIWIVLAGVALIVSNALDRLDAQASVPGVLAPAAALFVIGVAIFVAALPFSLWLPGVCDEAPIAAALAIGLLSCATMATLTETAGANSWLLIATSLRLVLGTGGGLAATVSAFIALGEKRPGRTLAFLISAGADFSFAGLASSPPEAQAAAIWLLGAQAVAAALTLGCLAGLRSNLGARERVGADHLNGLLWRRPLLAAALVVGLLSLIGMPLTAGFVGRWEISQVATADVSWLPLEVLVASIIGGLAALRAFGPIFEATDEPAEAIRPLDVVAGVIALALLIGGLVPGPLLAALQS